MEAPHSVRIDNCISLFHVDIRNSICVYLDGRSFARLGCCSYKLQHYVRSAESIWKAIYKQETFWTDEECIGNAKESLKQRGLVKRNARANHIPYFRIGFWELDAYFPLRALLCQEKIYVLRYRSILCYDKYGKRLPDVDVLADNLNLHKLEEDLIVAIGENIIRLIGRYNFFTKHCYGDTFIYYKDRFAYSDRRGTIHIIDLKNNCDEKSISNAHCDLRGLFALTDSKIAYQQDRQVHVTDYVNNETRISDYSQVSIKTHWFHYPHLILCAGESYWSLSIETLKGTALPALNYMVDQYGIIGTRYGSVYKINDHGNVECFKQTPSEIAYLVLEQKRITAFTYTGTFCAYVGDRISPSWDRMIPCGQICRHPYPYIKNNILIINNNENNSSFQFYDLSTGKLLGRQIGEGYRILAADHTSILCEHAKSLYLLSLVEPLPQTWGQWLISMLHR